jgi:hypothetical protein
MGWLLIHGWVLNEDWFGYRMARSHRSDRLRTLYQAHNSLPIFVLFCFVYATVSLLAANTAPIIATQQAHSSKHAAKNSSKILFNLYHYSCEIN